LLILAQRLQSHPSLAGTGFWDGPFLEDVAALALAYDWLYPALNESDRAALRALLLRCADRLQDPLADEARVYIPDGESFRFASYDHWGAQLIWALAATGLALLGEDPAAAAVLDYARDLFTGWMLPTLDSLGGGAWAEGFPDAWRAAWANSQTLAAFWTALGENYLDDSDWWADRLAYEMFAALPHQSRVGGEGPAIWNYPALLGMGERYSSLALQGRATTMLLSTLLAGDERAAWMAWFLAQGDPPPALSGPWAVEEFLWRDLDAIELAFPPPWNLWYVANAGQVFIRSTWAAEEANEALHLSFNAGDHYSRGQFYDQGHLSLARGDDELLIRGGAFGAGDSDHDANYYGRSIAANVPLICDLSENFDGIRPNAERQIWLNDCGQRGPAPAPLTAINPFYFSQNLPTYQGGGILRYAEEGSLHYFRADLTRAYNSAFYAGPGNRPKTSEVLREWVLVRPNFLLLHDRMSLSRPELTAFIRFHSPVAAQLSAAGWRVDVGDSRLFIQGLAPQNTAQLVPPYLVQGETLPPPGNRYEPAPPAHVTLEFVAPSGQVEPYFLTLLWIGETPPPSAYIQGQGSYGAVVGDWQIMFDDDAGDLSASRFPTSASSPNLLLTGLEPVGRYRVWIGEGGGIDLQADSAGTLYLFLQTPGSEVRLDQR
jgi:hypothetical protein